MDSSANEGENRRIYSKETGIERVNLYDIYTNLIAQYAPGSGLFKTYYVLANGQPRMKIDTLIGGLGPLAPPSNPETQFWYHTDHLGTPYVATDSFKSVRWKISLDPFGETVSEQNTSSNLRFPGQYLDRGSGLDYNWNRYYQPKIGRYYQADSYNRLLDFQLYNYVENQPLIAYDQEGDSKTRINTIGLGELEILIKNVIEGLPKGLQQYVLPFTTCVIARESGGQYRRNDNNIYFTVNRRTHIRNSSAFGLMQMTQRADADIIKHSFPYTIQEIESNPRINILAGLTYLDLVVTRAHGDLWGALQNNYGPGVTDPEYAQRIERCYNCLTNSNCVDPQRCIYIAAQRSYR